MNTNVPILNGSFCSSSFSSTFASSNRLSLNQKLSKPSDSSKRSFSTNHMGTPAKNNAGINSRFKEETISSSMKKRLQSRSVKFSTNENLAGVGGALSNKKPPVPSAKQQVQPANPFQSSFAQASQQQQNNKVKENSFLSSSFQIPQFKQPDFTSNKRAALNETNIQLNHAQNDSLNKIELFKNSNFSLIEFMKKTQADNKSENGGGRQGSSQISTPRLTPLKMVERNRNQVVSKDDINKLENKIKDLESQIMCAKKKGEEKQKLDILEDNLKKTEHSFIEEHLKSQHLHDLDEYNLLEDNHYAQQTPYLLQNEFSESQTDKNDSKLHHKKGQEAGRQSLTRKNKEHFDQIASIDYDEEEEEDQEDSDDGFEIGYDCSQMNLNQAFKEVFKILESKKLEMVEKQQVTSLKAHITELLEDIDTAGDTQNNKRTKKSCKKSQKKHPLTTIHKIYANPNERSERSSISPFEIMQKLVQTPQVGKANKNKTESQSHIMTRSQKKRKRRGGSQFITAAIADDHNLRKRRKFSQYDNSYNFYQ